VEAGLEPVRIPSPSGDWEWVKGHILASTKFVGGILDSVAKVAKKPYQAVALACVVMAITEATEKAHLLQGMG